MSQKIDLSLIMPVYNGEAFIKQSITRVIEDLEATGKPFEVIVVSDGSTDRTCEICESFSSERLKFVHYPDNTGKGAAICRGVEEAEGRYIGWLDSDLDIKPAAIIEGVNILDKTAADVVVGSKRHALSKVQYPLLRRLYSAVYQLLIRALFRVNVRDTQVGAKVFRREVLNTVCPLLLIKQYAFDLEVLAVSAEFGFDRVEEMPIELDYKFTGSGISFEAIRRMFTDTLAIAYRVHIVHWYVRKFASLQRSNSY